jgi:hypothetical protein
MKSAASRGSDEQASPPHFGGRRRRARDARSFGCGTSPAPLREDRCGVTARPPGVSQLLAVARLPTRPCFGIGDARQFSRDYDGSFGFRTQRVFGDVGVRASGSEHHRIGISSSHPVPSLRARTPVIPGSRRDSSEPRQPVPAPAGTPRPEEWTPAIEADRRSSDQRPPLDGIWRRSSSEPRPPTSPRVRTPRLFGARKSPPGIRDPFRRGPPLSRAVEPPRGTRRRSSSEPRPPPSPDVAPRVFGTGSPPPPGSAPATHSGEAGPTALRNDGPTSWDPATELFGAPPSLVPGPGLPVLRNRLAPSAGIGLPPFGARSPIPRLVSVVRPPRQRGSRSAWSPVSAGAPTPGRTVTTGRQRSQ